METLSKNSEMKNNSCRLNHEWIQVLINLRMKYAKLFTGKRHSATIAWDSILKEMHELGAPKTVTRLKLKKKWMNLIARYKLLKAEGDSVKQNAWPYFDQINRAYSRSNTDAYVPDDLIPSVSSNVIEKHGEKEKFMRSLIDMRYKYRNLFTGKKYAAQKGWMIIQNYLPSGTTYSTDHIKRIWHNLIHRYKSLLENEPDHSKITWIYFEQLHKLMLESNKGNKETGTEFVDEKSIQDEVNEDVLLKTNALPFPINAFEDESDEDEKTAEGTNIEMNINDNEEKLSLNNLLVYLKEREQKRDEQMKELLNATKEILLLLKRNV